MILRLLLAGLISVALVAAAGQALSQSQSYKPPSRGAADGRVGGGARDDLAHGRRIALVVGNGAYANLPRLKNPVSDAQLLATTLKSVGFELIGGEAQTDLDRAGFEKAIREFGAKLSVGAVGLFYYAGHGVQSQGVNFLIPVGANPSTVADLDWETISADAVLKQMEIAGSNLNIVILDACRNNPFGGRGLRGAEGGLAQMKAPRGTLISYATQPGNVASDGSKGHSPYTAALVEAMRRPGSKVLDVFNEAALAVDKATNGRQQPWTSSSPLEGVFYFLGPTTVNITPTSGASSSPADQETVFWQTIAASSNMADFEEYLRKYPLGQFAGLAHNRLAAARPPTPQVTEPPEANPHTCSPGQRLSGDKCVAIKCSRDLILAPNGRCVRPQQPDDADAASAPAPARPSINPVAATPFPPPTITPTQPAGYMPLSAKPSSGLGLCIMRGNKSLSTAEECIRQGGFIYGQ